MNDEEESLTVLGAPALGEPVLSCICDFSEAELRERIEREVPPSSAAEYLARVDLESRKIPDIVVAPPAQPEAKRVKKSQSNSWVLPEKIPRMSIDAAKREAFTSNFNYIHETLIEWESRLQEDESRRKALPVVPFPTSLERLQWMEFVDKEPPLMHALLRMDNLATVRGIRHIVKAYELDGLLTHRRGSWMFALLARLDRPFTDDVATTLRRFEKLLVLDVVPSKESDDPRELLRCLLEDVFGQAG